MLSRARLLLIPALVVLSGCGTTQRSASAPAPHATGAAHRVHWARYVHSQGVLDLVGPRADGSLVVAAGGKLWLLHRAGRVTRYAPAYSSPGGEEGYIALAGSGCFKQGTVYALRLRPPRGVVAIATSGSVREFARISAHGLIDGIAFDRTGRFGHRLLVTINAGQRTTVVAIGCHGKVAAITRHAPRMEGGIAVAPAGFGRFAGDLIAPDEIGGRIFAVTPGGRTIPLARSRLPYGQDVGVESAGFVPRGPVDAFVADRSTPGNPHPGDGVVLRLGPNALRRAGVRAGDLLVVSEGGSKTDAVRCARRGCRVWHAADGPPEAHGEGHVAFAPAG